MTTDALTSGGGSSSTGSQPVEFNHAIIYVNKIKVSVTCEF